MDNYDQPVGKQWGWYSSASGIWQTVFIEPRAAQFIQRFEITTDIAKSQRAISRSSPQGGVEVSLGIVSPTGEEFATVAAVVDGVAECHVALGHAVLWDTFSPQLYTLKLTLHDGGPTDVRPKLLRHAQPLRRIGQRIDRAGKSLPQRRTDLSARRALPIVFPGRNLYCGRYPDFARRHRLRQSARASIFCAFTSRSTIPLLLYYADTIGMLLMCDFPNFGEGGDTETGRRRYEETMRGGIERDFNHPSIVAWCLFNETWGFGGQAEFVKLINPSPPTAMVEGPLSEEN